VNIAAASKHAAVVASGRSDAANQINNVLVFPGIFPRLLDAQTNVVTGRMCWSRQQTRLANIIDREELNPTTSSPASSTDVAKVVAAAVRAAAIDPQTNSTK